MDDTISRAAAIDAMMKLQAEDIEAYGASIPEGFDGDRAVAALKALPSATDTNVGGNLSVDKLITFLNPESNYVFYDDSHGFCINTQDVLDHLCAMPSAQLAKDLPNTCTDAIGRQAAVETVRKAKDKSEAHRMLMQLPPAQTERKKGKWIERNPQNSPDCRLIECSECGNAYIVGYNINYDDWIDGRNFCMKCGADLRGGSNGKNT